MENYVVVNGKKYRKGYTTGSCAAAASKAAALILFSGSPVDRICIDTPAGIRLDLPVCDVEISNSAVKCAVIKDGGDDPDKTNGLKVFAEARFSDEAGIRITTGEGIGIVTLPGLKVPVGQSAINPVPMKMILKEVQEVLPRNRAIDIILSVPGGKEAAKETYNPKLGIIDGISILGTTGIVNPMSEDAWKESLAVELSVLAAGGSKDAVFTFGNYGESFAVDKLGVEKNKIIKISNFVGFMLDRAVEYGIERILLVGHLGKLVKVAAGIFQTHSRIADARMEILSAYAALEGASKRTVEDIYACKTTEAAALIIKNNGLTKVFDRITESSAKKCSEYTFNKIRFGAVLFNEDNTLLSMNEAANAMIRSRI